MIEAQGTPILLPGAVVPGARESLVGDYGALAVASLTAAQGIVTAIIVMLTTGVGTQAELDALCLAHTRIITEAGEHLNCRGAVLESGGVC